MDDDTNNALIERVILALLWSESPKSLDEQYWLDLAERVLMR